MSKKQIAEERKRAAAECRKQEIREKRAAGLAKAREVKAEMQRLAAELPKEIVPPKIRISPTGKVNRVGAAAILMRDPHTLENWAARGLGPEYELINGRAAYDVEKLLAWKGDAAE